MISFGDTSSFIYVFPWVAPLLSEPQLHLVTPEWHPISGWTSSPDYVPQLPHVPCMYCCVRMTGPCATHA